MAVRRMLRLPAVKDATGYDSTSQIYALMSRGEFPRPVKIGPQAVAWFADEIADWQERCERAVGGWSPRDRKRQSAPQAK